MSGKIIRLTPAALAMSEKLALTEAASIARMTGVEVVKEKNFAALAGARHSQTFVDLCAALFGEPWSIKAMQDAGMTMREIINVKARWMLTAETPGSIISRTGLFDPIFNQPKERKGDEKE